MTDNPIGAPGPRGCKYWVAVGSAFGVHKPCVLDGGHPGPHDCGYEMAAQRWQLDTDPPVGYIYTDGDYRVQMWDGARWRLAPALILKLATSMPNVTEGRIFEWVQREVTKMFPGRTIGALTVGVEPDYDCYQDAGTVYYKVKVEVSL